jgi:hypothetical protein
MYSGFRGMNMMNNIKLTSISMQHKRNPWFVVMFISMVLLFATPVNAAPPVIGKVSFIAGEGTAQQGKDEPRVLKKKNAILLGDIVTTPDDSYLIILFVDGAGVTLRPNTKLHIKEYDNEPGDEIAILEVLQGGIRTVSGEIAKKFPDRYRVMTDKSLVKAREGYGDFSVRLCENDCNEENRKMFPPRMKTSLPVIAKVVALKGEVVAGRKYKRRLEVGHSVYSTEHLVSAKDSYAHLQFRDGSSVSLQAESAFDIVNYKYNEPGYKNISAYKLIAGGLRFVTGLIGKKEPSAFSLSTRVVTIGVRGTDFSINCFGSCNTGGVVTHVTEGGITQQNQSGTYVLEAGSYSTISSPQSTPVVTKVVPFFNNNIAPEPSKIKIDTQSLFAEDASVVAHGAHISTRIGSVEIIGRGGNSVTLGANQSGYVGQSGLAINTGSIRNFQSLDPMAISPVPSNLVGKFMPSEMPDFAGSINTIIIGDPSSVPSPTADSTVGSTTATTILIQEQTIATPY